MKTILFILFVTITPVLAYSQNVSKTETVDKKINTVNDGVITTTSPDAPATTTRVGKTSEVSSPEEEPKVIEVKGTVSRKKPNVVPIATPVRKEN